MPENRAFGGAQNRSLAEPIHRGDPNGNGAPGLVEVQRAEIQGLPVFWGAAPGPFVAGLVFRVGRADERATKSGITHLVEHLALPAARADGIDFNGGVSGSTTWFWAAGEKGAALDLMRQTVASLSRLPDRLENERRILLTEAAGRSGGTAAALRFGPSGHGLVGYPEFGLRSLSLQEASDWARERFNGGNAALWMIGEPPADLGLSFPTGERLTVPIPVPLPQRSFPCVFPQAAPGGVTVSLLLERSSAASMVASIGMERLRNRLRFERGLSYLVDMSWEPLTRDLAHALFVCDCQQGSEREAALQMREVLEDLAESGPSEQELAREVEERRRRASDDSNLGAHLFYAATNELLGNRFASSHDLLVEATQVMPSSAAEALQKGMESALLLTLDERWQPEERWSLYPLYSEEALAGQLYRPSVKKAWSTDDRKARLVAGKEGVTFLNLKGEPTSVRFEDCEVLERWPDGARVLWGGDATRLVVDPSDWQNGERLVAWIDEHVATDRVVAVNPAVEQWVAELRRELGGGRGRKAVLSRELKAMTAHLDFGEVPIDAVSAVLDDKIGLLTLTSRRLLFTFGGGALFDLPLDAITLLEHRSGRWPRGQRLIVGAAETTYVLWDFVPTRRGSSIATAFREELDQLGSTAVIRDPLPWHASIPAYVSLSALPLSFSVLYPAAKLTETNTHARQLIASAVVILFAGGACAAGVWLGLLGRRHAAEGGDGSKAASIGIALGIIGALFWLAMSILVPATEW